MDILKPDLWEYFREIRSDGKKYFNGRKFEELIRDILLLNFDGAWDPTPITWDGGKDFVDRSIIGEQAWAECKMYEKTLSINKISNSLILAINKQNVNQLIFFSYSPLNQNAIYHLSSFACATSIKVQVFDDLRLEHLILKSKSILAKYFNLPFNNVNPVGTKTLSITSFFTIDTHVEYGQLNKIEGVTKTRTPHISVNTPCLYEIFIHINHLDTPGELSIDLSSIKKHRKSLGALNLSKLDLDKTGILRKLMAPGQVESLKLYLAPKKIGKVEVPSLEVKFKQERELIPPLKIVVSALNRPSLVGSKVLNELLRFERTVSAGSVVSTTIVTGKTGVGKTRFLEEAQIQLLAQNYIVLQFDGHSDACRSFNAFASFLLSQVWRLPNTYFMKDADEQDYPPSTGTDTMFDKVCSLLFSSQKHSISADKDIEEFYNLIAYGLTKQKVAVVIDNVQTLDADSLQLLKKLQKDLSGKPGQNVFLFAFNEDELIYSQNAAIFHYELKKHGAYQNDSSFSLVELPEFSKESVEMFLNTICGFMDDKETFTEHYPRLTHLIWENVLPRPLDL